MHRSNLSVIALAPLLAHSFVQVTRPMHSTQEMHVSKTCIHPIDTGILSVNVSGRDENLSLQKFNLFYFIFPVIAVFLFYLGWVVPIFR